MADLPILFKGYMVCGLLYDRKTNTRRVLDPQPKVLKNGTWYRPFPNDPKNWQYSLGGRTYGYCRPRYAEGDRLWVKETFQVCDCGYPNYRATVNRPGNCTACDAHIEKWKPSIFMPRAQSRLTLIVTGVKIERLQDISEADAQAEGVVWETADPPFCYVPGIWPHSLTGVGVEQSSTPFKASFFKLWDHVNKPGAAAGNPWVAAYTFTVIKSNIDRIAT